MRVLIATGIYPPEIGGPATVMEALVQELRASGHETVVVTYGDLEEGGEGIIRISRRGNVLSRYLRCARAIRSQLRIGTVLLATDVFSVGIPSRFALVGKRNPFILRLGGEWCWEDAVTNRGLHLTLREFWSQARGLRFSLMRFNYGWVLRRANHIAVTSSLLERVMSKIVPHLESRFIVLPNRISTASISSSKTKPHVPLRLMYIGRLARVKNVTLLVDVMRRLGQQPVPVQCTIVGDGPERDKLHKMAADIPIMEWLGNKPHAEAMTLLADADVLLLPSLTDICPNVVIEALAYGVPVILTSEHGLPSDIGGLIELNPRLVEAWVDAIHSLIDPQTYNDLRHSIRLPSAPQQTLKDILEHICPSINSGLKMPHNEFTEL